MKTIIFATNNANKVKEIQSIVDPKRLQIRTLLEAGIEQDIDEPYDSLEENSLTKAKTIFDITATACFAEDTGLFVEMLNGQPGVKSARYAGDDCNNENNISKLLQALGQTPNRKAYFKTVVTYYDGVTIQQFEGICSGEILYAKKGNNGFGYDAVFMPDGASLSFAEMDQAQKNMFSHRKKAMLKFISFIEQL